MKGLSVGICTCTDKQWNIKAIMSSNGFEFLPHRRILPHRIIPIDYYLMHFYCGYAPPRAHERYTISRLVHTSMCQYAMRNRTFKCNANTNAGKLILPAVGLHEHVSFSFKERLLPFSHHCRHKQMWPTDVFSSYCGSAQHPLKCCLTYRSWTPMLSRANACQCPKSSMLIERRVTIQPANSGGWKEAEISE